MVILLLSLTYRSNLYQCHISMEQVSSTTTDEIVTIVPGGSKKQEVVEHTLAGISFRFPNDFKGIFNFILKDLSSTLNF